MKTLAVYKKTLAVYTKTLAVYTKKLAVYNNNNIYSTVCYYKKYL